MAHRMAQVGFSPYTSRTELHQSSTTNLSIVSPYASQTELQASTPKLSLPEPEDYQAVQGKRATSKEDPMKINDVRRSLMDF